MDGAVQNADPMNPTRTRRGLLLALLLASTAPVRAQEAPRVIEGQTFAARAAVAGTELRLNGTGLRAVAWFKGFVAGLYLTGPARTPAQVLAQPGPKRLQLRMLQEVPAAEFVKALRKGIDRNAPEAERPRLAERVQRFADQISAAGTVHKGTVVDLDLDPQRGLLFAMNGTLRGSPVEGEDFYAALLRAFIGEHPYDERLKAGLLGAAPAR